MNGILVQLVVLAASGMLLTAFIPLWRRGVPAYIVAFRWQSWLLAGLTAVVAHLANEPELYWIAGILLLLKGIALPRFLSATERRLRSDREIPPYVNTGTSLLIGGVLVLFAYAITSPWMAVARLPTRGGLPIAMALLFVSLFIIVSRRKAIAQVIGFLMLENAIALLAVAGTFGVPLLVELGVFLDALMGFLVMQILIYDIHETFDTIDVEQLSQLRH